MFAYIANMVNWKKRLSGLGPGLITAALIFGPGSLTVTTKLGAAFGNQLLWIIIASLLFMLGYTKLATRIGLRIEGSLIKEVRCKFGKLVSILLAFGIFSITASFQAGNSIGAGISFAELFNMSPIPWIIGVSIIAIVLLFFRSFYKILERIMIILVLIMVLAFVLTLILSQPSLGSILNGLIPQIPTGSEILTIALIASSFSIVGAFYQSSLVKEKGWNIKDEKTAVRESQTGIIILGCLSALVMVCASSVLYGNNISVNTAADLGKALTPLFGKSSSTAFMIGFFAASFSSLIGNATIGGSVLAEGLGFGNRLSDWNVRLTIMTIIIIGSAIAIIFGGLPLQLIILAQAVTILVAPAAAFFILAIAVQLNLIHMKFNWTNLILLLGILTLVYLAIYNFNYLFLT